MTAPIFVESAVATGIKALLQSSKALVIDSDTTASIRCFWLDDETESEVEDQESYFVCVTVSPNVPGGYRIPMRTLGVSVVCATNMAKDPKSTKLATLYKNVRHQFDTGTFSFANVTFNGATITGASSPDVVENFFVVEFSVDMEVCANYEV